MASPEVTLTDKDFLTDADFENQTLTDNDFLTDADFEQSKGQQPKSQMTQMLGKFGLGVAGLGAAGAVGAGLGAIGAGYHSLRQPQVRSELAGVNNQLLGIQKTLPSNVLGKKTIEGTTSTFIPKKIKQVSDELKNQLNTFDETMIAIGATDLSKTIKENYSSFIKSGTDAYGKGLDQLDEHFIKSGKNISTDEFSTFLDNVIKKAESGGILPQEYSTVSKLKSLLEPKKIESGLVDIYGKPAIKYKVRQMPFSEAKGYVSSLVSENPYGAVSGMLRENWGSFLEQNAPPSISKELGLLNRQYKTFAQARTQLSRVVDPKTGEFNISKLNNYLIKYTKQRHDEGIVELMKMLGDGTELTPSIKGVSSKFEALSQLRNKRFTNTDAITAQLDKLNKLKSTSEELINRGSVLQSKIDSRSVSGMLGKIFKLGKKVTGILSVVPNIVDAFEFQKDPIAYMGAMESGVSIEEMKDLREKYRKGEVTIDPKSGKIITQEEAIRKGLAG